MFPRWNSASETDLLRAHEMLMVGLLDAPGCYRRVGVAVGGGGQVHHVGPPADRVPHLMANLLSWLRETTEHPLIASAVFHYEFEFIHPFEDGNGRMGRLWQTLILTRWNPLFAWIPVGKPDSCAPERVLRGHSGEFCQGREHPVHHVHARSDSRGDLDPPSNPSSDPPSNTPALRPGR